MKANKRSITFSVILVLLLGSVACSEPKKVGSAIDVEDLAEENEALGRLKEKKDDKGGFVGEAEKEDEEATTNDDAGRAAQEEAAAKQKEEAAVAFSITETGYNPYALRVYEGGVVTVVNRFSKAASVTADRGEFDSGMLEPGETWTFEPSTPGKFNFHDEGRPYVVGSLEVLAR
jgi:plastocyanin